jgi:hypothetical protein
MSAARGPALFGREGSLRADDGVFTRATLTSRKFVHETAHRLI